MSLNADFVPLPPTSLPRPLRYAAAVAIVAAATLLRLAADPILQDQVPFFIYVGASVVATWVAGVEGGILATVVAAFAGNYFFVPPRREMDFSAADLGAMLTFGLFSLGLVWLVGRWRTAETRVRALHARTANVLNQMPVAVVLAEPSGRIVFQNLASTRLFGGPLPPVIDIESYRHHFNYAVYRPDGTPLDAKDAPIARALEGEAVSGYEARIVHADGTHRTLTVSAAPIRDEADRIVSAIATFTDVTEQRLADEALRERTEELQTVLDAVPAAVYVTRDSQASLIEGNRFAAEYVRMPPGANLSATAPPGQAPTTFRPAKDGKEILPGELPVQLAIARGVEVRDYELDLLYDDGGKRTLFGNATPLRDEDGRIRGAVGAFMDVTELKRAGESLKESEARFRSVLDGSRDVVYRLNLETGRYEYISPAATQVLTFSPDEVVASDFRTLSTLIHPDDQARIRSLIEALSEKGSVEVEYRQRTKTGDYRWMSNHMWLVRGHDGRPLFRDGNIRDVTERKRIEAELQRRMERLGEQADALERANRMKDEFLTTLSHELRTPLNAILGWSDMLVRPGLSEELQRKALESINRNAKAQAALIGDILDVSGIITGKLRLEVRPVDLRDVVKASCESIQPAANARSVQIRATIHPQAVVLGDPDRLQQVIWNLLSNSVKFSEAGGEIDVDVRQVDSHVRIVVKDKGIGIAPDLLPHVFERFRQADSSTTRARGGLGLGLAIVRHLVELHGGTVTAESEGAGRGATFVVNLPAGSLTGVIDGRVLAPGARAAGASADDAGCLAGLRIVAVDDQEETRLLVQAVLEGYGARVTVCSTAEETLAAVTRERPDVLVADIGMPAVDGYELIRRVRASPGYQALTLPAVALTAYGSERDREKALAAGYWEHLAKPIVPEALALAVAAVARRSPRLAPGRRA